MNFTAEQIAVAIEGEIEGNPKASVSRLSKIEEGGENAIAFLADMKFAPFLYTTPAAITIVTKDFTPEQQLTTTLIRVEDPRAAFVKILALYQAQKPRRMGISERAFIAPDAVIGENVYIGDFALIESGVTIGDHTAIYPHAVVGAGSSVGQHTTIHYGVKIYEDTVVGSHCIVHAGAVIGADGFGFALQTDRHYQKIEQTGNVVIEDHVEIGANTTIDKATMGSTIIRKGVKLDNLVQIAHNVVIGENTVIVAQTGVAGSTKIGKNCIIGGQVGIIDHLTIGDNVKIAAQSGIGNDVADNKMMFGAPAVEAIAHKKMIIHTRNLDKHIKRIDALEKKQPIM
ncbi:MAG: UDP-3-O-(3-hydroxymyristoyl)glucosamine N-acyltransferase [Bacteroidales bacterium]|nr:UDP-3-O-(3-hydroxymyristoyl)glucosamine N-acyltransferase [Bacteroidales bacterium]